jgi:hypothetical protein
MIALIDCGTRARRHTVLHQAIHLNKLPLPIFSNQSCIESLDWQSDETDNFILSDTVGFDPTEIKTEGGQGTLVFRCAARFVFTTEPSTRCSAVITFSRSEECHQHRPK